MRIFEDSNWFFKYYKRRNFSVTWQFSSILEEKKIISVAIGRVFFFFIRMSRLVHLWAFVSLEISWKTVNCFGTSGNSIVDAWLMRSRLFNFTHRRRIINQSENVNCALLFNVTSLSALVFAIGEIRRTLTPRHRSLLKLRTVTA